MRETYRNCEADFRQEDYKDFWVIGEDISEEDAVDLPVEIRPGPNGSWYIWLSDLYSD